MGIFPNAASKEYCEDVIKWFEHNNKPGIAGRKRTSSRQEDEKGVAMHSKDSELYWLGLDHHDGFILNREHPLLTDFATIVWKAYDQFKLVYGSGLNQLGLHKISPSIKIQRYKPTQGYHVLHSDITGQMDAIRILVCALYLNTVEEGGETEFLYQQERVAPVQGTLVIFPAGWTHIHRGNPPLKGVKYLMHTWMEFTE